MEGLNQNFVQEDFRKEKSQHFLGWLTVLAVPFRLLPVFLFWGVITLVLLTFIYALALVPQLQTGRQVIDEALAGRESVLAAQTALGERNFSTAETDLYEANSHFSQAEELLTSLEKIKLLQVRSVREQVLVGKDLLEIGQELSLAMADIAGLAANIGSVTNREDLNFDSISEDEKVQLLAGLTAFGKEMPALRQRQAAIDLVWSTLQQRNRWPMWNEVMAPLEQYLPMLDETFDYIDLAAETVPSVLGYPDGKTYLFLLLNNNEIRPSGGFIGTYGLVKVSNGELVSFDTDNIYNLDRTAIDRVFIDPPEPIKKYLRQDQWFMRDANWWPDYPTSVANIEDFYHLEADPGEDIDGVIGITPDLLSDLLRLVGSITIADVTFTPENFFEELEYQVEFGYYKQGIPEGDRKEIIGALAEELESRLFKLPAEKWKTLFDLLRENMDEKYVLLNFKDAAVQDVVLENNWGGVVKETSEDYLQVVDANLAALKTDAVMKREISYSIVPMADGHLRARTVVNYIHTSPADHFTSRYRTYTRLYVPEGSTLVKVQAGRDIIPLEKVDVFDEFGKTAYGLFFEVEVLQSKKVIFEYDLPDRILQEMEDGEYTLTVQKQSGIRELGLALDLTFPKNLLLPAVKDKKKQVRFSDTIKKDQIYTVLFE